MCESTHVERAAHLLQRLLLPVVQPVPHLQGSAAAGAGAQRVNEHAGEAADVLLCQHAAVDAEHASHACSHCAPPRFLPRARQEALAEARGKGTQRWRGGAP